LMTTQQHLYFHHCTREEIARLAKQGTTVVVPLGATEQHGHHLPVYTDSIICEYIVQEAVRKAIEQIPILMTPLMAVGCSQHHLGFNGTISISSSTYLNMLHDILESLYVCGFRKIIVVNGHGGNHQLMNQAVQDLTVRHQVWTAAASYWNVARAQLNAVNAGEVGKVPGHAGGFETALVQAIRPELVRSERILHNHRELMKKTYSESGVFIGKHGELTGYDGFTDAADKATADKGREYLDIIVQAVSQWFVEVHGVMNDQSI